MSGDVLRLSDIGFDAPAALLARYGLALVRVTYARALLGRGIALNSMVVASASVLGPSLAAAVLSVADWPWLFALAVLLLACAAAAGVRGAIMLVAWKRVLVRPRRRNQVFISYRTREHAEEAEKEAKPQRLSERRRHHLVHRLDARDRDLGVELGGSAADFAR